jgi:hypothetical protein
MASYKVPISDLFPCAYNPRKIKKVRAARLAASIKAHTGSLVGWDIKQGYRLASTVTINKNGKRIIGGHQRVDALKTMGQDWIHESDITWVSVEPDSAEEKALNVSLNDNKAGGVWDDDKLLSVLTDIKDDNESLFEDLSLGELGKSLDEVGGQAGTSEEIKAAGETKTLIKDNVSFVVQEILSKHGDTIPQGFIFFMHKDKLHMLVQCDDETYEMTKSVADGLKRDHAQINDFLKTAFSYGVSQEKWSELSGKAIRRANRPVDPEEVEGEDKEN